MNLKLSLLITTLTIVQNCFGALDGKIKENNDKKTRNFILFLIISNKKRIIRIRSEAAKLEFPKFWESFVSFRN
jgi:hypothetical protein